MICILRVLNKVFLAYLTHPVKFVFYRAESLIYAASHVGALLPLVNVFIHYCQPLILFFFFFSPLQYYSALVI